MTAPSAGLSLKGINYDTGTNYAAGYLSREVWHMDKVRAEIRTIREDLHCNAITIFGSDADRIRDCAEIALAHGLQVWLQPRLLDSTPDEMLAHLAELAACAEELRQPHAHITLNIGCELSIFMHGLIPGNTYLRRARWLGFMWWLWMLWPSYNRRLNDHLKRAIGAARSHFKGPITYGSGIWESVDWAGFDLIGLNYYRERANQATYVSELRRFHTHGKPIVITEFGCCSFDGADKLGGSGDRIMDYSKPQPQLRRVYRRNEQVQAGTLIDLLTIYEAEGMHGAFVFEFTEPSHPHSDDPRHDLDIASYGIVKVMTDASGERWEPKQAYHALAAFYGAEQTGA